MGSKKGVFWGGPLDGGTDRVVFFGVKKRHFRPLRWAAVRPELHWCCWAALHYCFTAGDGEVGVKKEGGKKKAVFGVRKGPRNGDFC